ncbi:multiple sugar transport system substrate-binding protein [Microbacterium trichothecenolyticum]|uniref:ABC transporter substrate-binding protein n=1 Tax=Microbacterium trichothecenolyticum TaxID=69370 RepID=UPI002861CD87|nr:extracellular solute-binding protein [Microbacterium trichothecenolyticum]MDR7186880.1 multiple sugar transport system substrate-binding protein [Microbacterium trichothecenolyticum]
MTSRAFTSATARRGALTAGAVLAVGVVTLLTGCAGGGAEPAASADPDEEVTLNFAWWGDASRAERYEAAIDLFEEQNPNITIQTSYASFGDYWTSRNTEAASRTLPDVFQMDLAYLAEYGGFGHVLPLDDYLGDAIDTDGIDPSLVQAGAVDDKIVGLASSSSTLATLYNGPLLEQLGVEVPDGPLTWDEYDDFLAEVSKAGAANSPAVYGSLDYTQYFWLFQIWLGQQGLSLIDGDELGFEKGDLADWWSRSATLQESGGVMPAERQAQLEGVDALGAGEIASDVSWANFLARFSEGPAKPELSLASPPYDDEDNTGMFLKPGLMLSIGANSEHPAQAAKFIDFLVNDPEVGAIFGMSRGVPASSSAAEGIEANELDEKILAYQESVADQLDGQAPPAVKGLGTLEQTFVAISQDVAYGAATPEEATDRWFAEAENALK